jgi:hypothetical protein
LLAVVAVTTAAAGPAWSVLVVGAIAVAVAIAIVAVIGSGPSGNAPAGARPATAGASHADAIVACSLPFMARAGVGAGLAIASQIFFLAPDPVAVDGGLAQSSQREATNE